MKILVIGDPHIWDEYKVGYIKYNKSSRLFDFINLAKEIRKVIIKRKIRIVIVTGDLFHKRKHDSLTTKYVSKFLRIIKSSGVKHIIVNIGNHDKTKKKIESNYVKPLIDMADKVFYCPKNSGEIFNIKVKNINISFFVIPYDKDDFMDKVINLLKVYKENNYKGKKFLIMHQDLKGFLWDNSIAMEGIEKKDLHFLMKKYRFIVNGHHHTRNEIIQGSLNGGVLKGLNSGILMPIDFKLKNIEPHVDIISVNKKTKEVMDLEYIGFTRFPIFEEYEIDCQILSKFKLKNNKKRFLKLRLLGTKQQVDRWIAYNLSIINEYLEERILQSIHYDPIYTEINYERKIKKDITIKELFEDYIIENDGNIEDTEYIMNMLEN